MADEVTGQWGTLSLAVPDYLEDIRDVVNDFAEYLVALLEVMNAVLDFAKAFIRGYLDPLVALIQILIDEVMAILRDLRQIGVYITGDWALLGWPPKDLRGGFAAYERRMIARLSDRTDPTRPNLSSATKVMGLFGYLSVDATEFERLINFIIGILRLFGQSYWPDTSRLPIPQIRSLGYGLDALTVTTAFQFQGLSNALAAGGGTPPSQCRVAWVTLPAARKNPLNPFPIVGPSGYIVTVSTIPTGISLKYNRVIQNTDKKSVDGDDSRQAQPRESGNVLDADSRPVVLYGGAEMLAFNEPVFGYNDAINTTTKVPKDGSCQVYGFVNPASNEVIPLEDLGTAFVLGTPGDGLGEDYVLQRTFLIDSNVAQAQWFAGEYSAVLSLDDMPQAAHWERDTNGLMVLHKEGKAAHYYVRVHSVAKSVADASAVPRWDFTDETIAVPNAFKSGQPFIVNLASGNASLGMPSAVRKITFVGAHTQDYLHALETALLVLVLSRSDLPLKSEIEASKTADVAEALAEGKWPTQNFALLATGLEDSKHLIGHLFPREGMLEEVDQSPVAWRTDLFQNIRQLALDIYEKTGPMPDAEKAVVEATGDLRTVTWPAVLFDSGGRAESASWMLDREYAEFGVVMAPLLVTALDPSNPVSKLAEFGPCPNPQSLGFSSKYAGELPYVEGSFELRGISAAAPEGEFVLWGGDIPEITFEEPDPAKVVLLKRGSSGDVRMLYERFTLPDGSLLVSEDWRQTYEAVAARSNRGSSGDSTPVFIAGASTLKEAGTGPLTEWEAVYSMRGLLRNYGGPSESPGILYRQSASALRIATAAFTRSPQDGEWLAYRLFDAFPELEDFLNMIENWVRSVAAAVQSMADAIIKYIEFVQGMIIDLQQLIRRINALIQGLLSFAYTLPQFNGLLLLSDGTDGLMADLVAADNKPSDSPLAYGGGIALVVPVLAGSSFFFDLVTLAGGEEPDPKALTAVTGAPDPIGIEQIEPGAIPSSNEPDVL